MSFKSRDIRHFQVAGLTLGVDVREGEARVAVAFQNPTEPNYSRPAGRTHINLRFDADDSTLKTLGLDRNVWTFPYSGTQPRNDIMAPLVRALEDEMAVRVLNYRKPGRVAEIRKIIRAEALRRARAVPAA